jgi:hypothetical protein
MNFCTWMESRLKPSAAVEGRAQQMLDEIDAEIAKIKAEMDARINALNDRKKKIVTGIGGSYESPGARDWWSSGRYNMPSRTPSTGPRDRSAQRRANQEGSERVSHLVGGDRRAVNLFFQLDKAGYDQPIHLKGMSPEEAQHVVSLVNHAMGEITEYEGAEFDPQNMTVWKTNHE